MSSWETPNTTAPIFDQTQAPAHIAQGSCVEYNTKSGRYRPYPEETYFNVSSSTCLMDEPEVLTRLPADAMTISRFPMRSVMAAQMELSPRSRARFASAIASFMNFVFGL